MATLTQAIEQMLDAGLDPFPDGHPRTSGRIERYGRKKRSWYVLHQYQARNGRRFVAGAYGVHGRVDSTRVRADYAGIDPDEIERLQRAQREKERAEAAKRLRLAEFAANRARGQYQAAARLGGSAYLERKGVKADRALRFQPDGTLLVPMVDYAGETPILRGLQKISPDGAKRFTKHMHKAGVACLLGSGKAQGPILIVEGLATGLSVRMALEQRHAVYVAFDCGNLAHVARALRQRHPDARLVICADDDARTICGRHQAEGATAPLVLSSTRPSWCRCNPGQTYAHAIAAELDNCIVATPKFVEQGALKDWNDLHVAEGLEVAAAQLQAALEDKPKKPPRKDKSHGGGPLIADLVRRYVLIYGTETVYDRQVERIERLSAIRAAWGRTRVEIWQMMPERKMVDRERVLWDPGGPLEPEGAINLFRGMPTKPKPGKCDRILELLYFLCGESPEDDQAPLTDWCLKWAAYPLQHPGAKMRTSIVMHGKDGAGKNLFWGVVRAIYGKYGGIIGQQELESDFNDWSSQKLFVIANEVISRHELRHQVGKLKNLITETELQINAKNLPLRVEANRMNLVFFSNELQPIWLDGNDRRYLVVRTPKAARDAEFYAAVDAEVRAGGIEALYDYLLRYPLGEFTEHTKPLLTQAKEDIVELGTPSAQLFWQELHEGLLPLPYCSALSEDLYRAFVVWCRRNGEKSPAKINIFSAQFRAMNGVVKRAMRVLDPTARTDATVGAQPTVKRTVFVMSQFENAPTDDDIQADVELFADELRRYADPYT